jgi:hypothetical protein
MSNPTEELAKYVVFEFHGDKQFIPKLGSIHPKKESGNELGNTQLESLQKAYLAQARELSALRSSYSLKFGRFITKSIVLSLGRIPGIKKWIINMGDRKK